MNRLFRFACLALATSPLTLSGANPVPYVEDYVLNEDKESALGSLIPGTPDYYYYHALHFQKNQDRDSFKKTVNAWIKRFKYSSHQSDSRLNELVNRQVFIDYAANPDEGMKAIREHYRMTFNHSKETRSTERRYASLLDQDLFSWDTLTAKYLNGNRYSRMGDITAKADDRLASMSLNDLDFQSLMARFDNAEHPNALDMITRDFKLVQSKRGTPVFGARPLHKKLHLKQLIELGDDFPALKNNSEFIKAVISRLEPSADIDISRDHEEARNTLNRYLKFSDTLGVSHHSLRLTVLHHLLELNIRQGRYDRDLFTKYIAIPQSHSYANQEYLRDIQYRKRQKLSRVNSRLISMSSKLSVNDIIRVHLLYFLNEDPSTDDFEMYLSSRSLNAHLAEAQIVSGKGDRDRWVELIGPSEYKNLRERVDVEFALDNPVHFSVGDDVNLKVNVKNVDKLIIRAYSINEFNYYKLNNKNIDLDMNLDGLVTNNEKVIKVGGDPYTRKSIDLKFPELEGRGVTLVEVIGGGKRSRALIRKGELKVVTRGLSTGHKFVVVNDENERVKDASIWMKGHEYTADKNGAIMIPYSSSGRYRQDIIIRLGDFASRSTFNHFQEIYSLKAGFHVDREQLLPGATAHVLVRPALNMQSVELSPTLLKHVALDITTTNLEGVRATKTVPIKELSRNGELKVPFRVPDNLMHIQFTLRGKMANFAKAKEDSLSATKAFSLNGIKQSYHTAALFLTQSPDGYTLLIKGQNGEVRPNQTVALNITNKYFRSVVSTTLQADEKGRINLGPLKDVSAVQASFNGGSLSENYSRTWRLLGDDFVVPMNYHIKEGDHLMIPNVTGKDDVDWKSVVFQSVSRSGQPKEDLTDRVEHVKGLLVVEDLARGDYRMTFKDRGKVLNVRVSAGDTVYGHIVNAQRSLELPRLSPFAVEKLETDDDEISIKFSRFNDETRVHVIGAYYLPEYDFSGSLGYGRGGLRYYVYGFKSSRYMSGVRLSDEYRYVFNRRYAQKYPGVMIDRPTLLLNPMELKETASVPQRNNQGGEFAESKGEMDTMGVGGGAGGRHGRRRSGGRYSHNLDHLAQTSVLLANLTPDEDGNIKLDVSQFNDRHHLRILIVDRTSMQMREVTLEPKALKTSDRRLMAILDDDDAFSRQTRAHSIEVDKSLKIENVNTSRFEVFDSLGDLFNMYKALGTSPNLQDYSFMTGWKSLDDKEKREKYSKHACHELNYFIFHRDRDFFNTVIKGYLANKKEKTFVDEWLLDMNLDRYHSSWHFSKLNAFERALLLKKSKGQKRDRILRHFRNQAEQYQWTPQNLKARLNAALETAVMSGSSYDPRFKDSVSELSKNVDFMAKSRFEGKSKYRSRNENLVRKMSIMQEPNAAPAKPFNKKVKEMAQAEVDEAYDLDNEDAKSDNFYAERRRQLYREIDKTKEYVETHYATLRRHQLNEGLIVANPFWSDFANHVEGPFLSKHFAVPTGSLNEILLALAVTDLPFEAGKHEVVYEKNNFDFKAATASLMISREIVETTDEDDSDTLLVRQNFYPADERTRTVKGKRVDNFVSGEFLTGKVYGCQIVLTNTGSSQRSLEILSQIPEGSIPVAGSQETLSRIIRINPFQTHTHDFFFYFPSTGKWGIYPVNVNDEQVSQVNGRSHSFKAVDSLSKIDKKSWSFVSQEGSEGDVLDYLKEHNPQNLNLTKIAFRMKDSEFFNEVAKTLEGMHHFDATLWSYAVLHDDVARAREYFERTGRAGNLGSYFVNPLVTINPIDRVFVEHVEYAPLVNSRMHSFGEKRSIANKNLFGQYNRLLNVLKYKPELNNEDWLSIVYYLHLQDRHEEALKIFSKIDGEVINEKLQYDYLKVYRSFLLEDLDTARQIVEKHINHAVPRWQKRFQRALNQLDEIEGKATGDVVDVKHRDDAQSALADTEVSLDVQIEGSEITVNYRNLENGKVNYYFMDTELIFSKTPFSRGGSGGFSTVEPNESLALSLDGKAGKKTFELPQSMHRRNVLVEVTGGGKAATIISEGSKLNVSMAENYGQLTVRDSESGKAVAKAYVKVYARTHNGVTRFHKDGYTDLRGKFDYVSVSETALGDVSRLSLLVIDEDKGSVIREVNPPKR